MITFIRYSDFDLFKQDVVPLLECDEIKNNLPLGVLINFAPGRIPLYMAMVLRNQIPLLVLLQTNQYQLIVSRLSEISSEEITQVADKLCEHSVNVDEMVGEEYVVKLLAEKMAEKLHCQTYVKMLQGVYGLRHLKKWAEHSHGKLEIAIEKDEDWLSEWFTHFGEDAFLPVSKEEASQLVQGAIRRKQLYLWVVDGQPVSMARITRPTKTNAAISWVYTPPERRNRGYATNIVAALTEHLLNSGYQTVSLFTDLANPTSNKIYQGIGFEQLTSSVVMSFVRNER
ncbi:MAG TPA: GNAT family N-acetyltransferase [Candidatus Hydrothermia bacterium]|nr:GNAT family N-acetyltransferase [Fervidobacterium sp.]HOL24638.1 GNAT family N-acetyltransferase [Candidatus Hydrothermia bacterium]